MNIKTTIYKSPRDGWTAKSVIPLAAPHSLRVDTYKSRRGLVTVASRVEDSTDGSFSFEVFGDFNARVVESAARCTEKTVTEQHNGVLSNVADLIAKCDAFYAAKN